ncbi:MAG TPA: hypothetical protein PKV72_06020, partial [Candidatus Peribacteria bacterium]|nr:hypothetical protein [Candidatus Peribacteria bacterium]
MQLQSYRAFMGTPAQNRTGNRELDTLVNGDLASRLTDDAIDRSERRYGPREPVESRPERFRREPLVDAVFNNTRNRPIAFVSTTYNSLSPHNYSFDPTSPEFALCQALASPPNRMTEDNPQAVFFEFERNGNEITALATYVDGTTRVRRRSARATVRSRLALRGGERAQTIEGVVHTGAMVHGIDMNRVSALRHFILNGGDTEGDDQLAPRGNRTTNLWEAQMPPMGVPQLNLIQRSVKRRNRERVEEALKAVGEDSASLVPGKFVPAGMDESGRAQYIMHLPGADNGRDAYVLKSVRNPQQALNAATPVRVRVGDAIQTIQVQYPNQDQFDTYTYHSQGDQWDETISLSNLNELLRRPNLTFHDRERAMRYITAGHDRTSDAEPVQSELLRFLSNFPTQMRPGAGMPPAQDKASFLLAMLASAAYEAAANKNAFLWELSDRITQLSSGIVMFDKIPDITRDLGNRAVPRSLALPAIGESGMAFNSGINEYGVRYFAGDEMRLGTINESAVGSRPYSSGRVDRLNREGVSSKVYVRRYGSAQTVVRSNGFVHEWSTLNYLRERTGNDRLNAERREIFENIITAPSTIANPGNDRTQMYHFLRPVNRILDGWMYEEQCFDVREQIGSASDGRQRFAGIIGRMYLEATAEQRQDFLRTLFTVMERIDGSDGQNDGILSANWETTNRTDITRELDGATLCKTFQSVIMELRRRFPVSEERLARESLRSMGTLPTGFEVAMAPASRQALLTRSAIQIGDLRYHVFVRGARQPDSTVLRQSAVRIVPLLSDEQSLLSMRNWSEQSPTLQTGVTATGGVAPGSNAFRPRELRYALNYARRVNITTAAPTVPVNELPAEPPYFNGTLVSVDAADLTFGPVNVTRTNARRPLSVVRVNTG